MEDDDLIIVDATESSEPTRESNSVPNDREDSFRKTIKDSGTRVNIENLTRSFFSGDVEDRERLVRVLKKAQIMPAKIETIYSSWFEGNYPEDDGIDLYNKLPKKNADDSGYNAERFVEDMAAQDRIAQKDRMITLQTKKRELEIQKEIKDLGAMNNDTPKSTERLEPVIIMDDDGNVEVATDKDGKPITKRIIEPVNSSSGGSSSMTELIMMQKLLGNDNKHSNDGGMSVIKIQGLESEITRLKDRNDSESDRHNDRIAEKDKEIASIKESMSGEVSRLKEESVKEIERIRENHSKEMSDVQKRHDDKIENIEQRHHDNVSAINDRHQASEDRLSDKMERVEADATESIGGLQYRHHEELSRLHADYKQQLNTFMAQSRGDLDSVKTMHHLETVHRDDMDAKNKLHESDMKVLEKRIDDNKNLSASEKQNEKIIEAVSGGIGAAFDAVGKPYVANMQTQQLINQKNITENAMAQRQAQINAMRGAGHSDEEISYVVDGNADHAHDDAYEQILEEESVPVEHNEPEQYVPPPTPHIPTPLPKTVTPIMKVR